MPTESPSIHKQRSKMNVIRRVRQSDSDAPYHSGTSDANRSVEESVLPPTMRHQLHDLFGQIEREFEALYLENLTLHSKLDLLHEQLEKGGMKVDTGDNSEASTYAKLPLKKPASQISQRLKLTYKTSTSKIVSSFKQASQGSQFVRQYRGHRDGVWEVTGSHTDPHIIGTAAADHTARLWHIDSGSCVGQYTGHNGSVNSIRFHPMQDFVVTASGDQTAHIWRANITVYPTASGAHSGDATKASHNSSDDDIDALERDDEGDGGGDDISSTIRQPIVELSGHSGVVIAADWLTGGSQVITASWDRTANIYDAEKGEILNTLTGHDQELTNVCTHPSQRIVVTSSKDTTFRLWDFREPSMKLNVFGGHTQPVTTAVFAGVDKVVSGSDDRTVRVWDLKNMRSPIATIRTDAAINRLAVSTSLNLIAIPHDNRHVRLYDLAGNRVGRLPRTNRQGHTRMVCSAAFHDWPESAASNLFTCGFDRQVIGWNITNAKE